MELGGFLERLDLLDKHLDSFRDFWPFTPWVDGRISPRGTPHWDALARVPLKAGSSGVVMVEAKAHRGEFVKPDDKSGAQPEALSKIKASFETVRAFYGISATAPAWESRYYQVGNRLAHLYWMNEDAKVPTWLVWVFVVDDPVWRDGLSASEWHEAFETVKKEIGLPSQHPLVDRVVAVYLPPAPEPTSAVVASS